MCSLKCIHISAPRGSIGAKCYAIDLDYIRIATPDGTLHAVARGASYS